MKIYFYHKLDCKYCPEAFMALKDLVPRFQVIDVKRDGKDIERFKFQGCPTIVVAPRGGGDAKLVHWRGSKAKLRDDLIAAGVKVA